MTDFAQPPSGSDGDDVPEDPTWVADINIRLVVKAKTVFDARYAIKEQLHELFSTNDDLDVIENVDIDLHQP